MKNHASKIIALLISCLSPLAEAAVVVPQGSSVSFSFNAMSLVQTNASPLDQAGFYFRASGDLLTPGDKPKVELFEQSTNDAAFSAFAYLYTNRDQPSDLFGGTQLRDNVWNDFQGALRITMLSGSVSIDSVVAWAVINGDRYETGNLLTITPPPSGGGSNNGDNSSVEAVPLPASLPLMLSAMAGFIGLRRKS